MKKFLLLLLPLSCFAQVDVSRMPRDTWPYWIVGVPGGIPVYTNSVDVTSYGAVGDGTTVCDTAFANAMAACTDYGAVVVPAGSYRLNSTLTIPIAKHIVIRGAAYTGRYAPSVLLLYANAGPIITIGDGSHSSNVAVNGGFNRGSTNITVASTTGMVAGQYIRMYQLNDDPAWNFGFYENANSPPGSNPHQTQSFEIYQVVDSTHIYVTSPVYFANWNNTYSIVVDYFTTYAYRQGFEDIGIAVMATQSDGNDTMRIKYSNECWIKHVAMSNACTKAIALYGGYKCEVRDSQFWWHSLVDSSGRANVAISTFSSDCLVENNIMEGGNALVHVSGCDGNVVAYNFGLREWTTPVGSGYPSPTEWGTGIGVHGAGHHNLLEGNVCAWISNDDFWGENRGSTVFRNWAAMYAWGGTNGPIINRQAISGTAAMIVDSTNYYHNIVGNILGSSRDIGDTGSGNSSYSIGYERKFGSSYPSTPIPDITNVTNRTVWQGNYTYTNQLTYWSNNVPLALSNSYYLTSKPAFFASMSWPPIGPDVTIPTGNTTNTIVIPAQYFEFNGSNPPASGGSTITHKILGKGKPGKGNW